MLRIETTGADDLRAMAKRIRQTGDPKQIRKDLVKGLKAGAKPGADRVKIAAMALPARPGRRSTGLRRRMAAATSVQVRTGGRDPGVSVRISRARMGTQASLPKVTNIGHWRHPVFARNKWVTQRSIPGWFDDATRSAAPAVRGELQKVLDNMERKLSRRI